MLKMSMYRVGFAFNFFNQRAKKQGATQSITEGDAKS